MVSEIERVCILTGDLSPFSLIVVVKENILT